MGCKGFLPKFSQTCPKSCRAAFADRFCGVTSKKCSSPVFLQTLGAVLPRFSGILPRCLGILFGFSGSLPKFSDFLPTVSGILPGFSTNQNFWGCACTPASYTTSLTSLILLSCEKERFPEQFVAIRDK